MVPKVNPWREIYDSKQSVNPFKYGLPKFALYIDVEPTNDCNFDCKFCVRQQMKREIGYMNIDLIEKIAEQAERYGSKGLRFLRWGEPLLNKHIVDFVKITKKHNLLTHITTNGSLLTKKISKELIEAGLDSLIVSFQGLDKNEYTNLRGNHYDRVVNNLKNFIEIRNKSKVGNTWVHLSTTVTDETEDEINSFKKKWENVVDSVGVGYTWFRRIKDKSGIKDYVERQKPLPHYFRCIEVMTKLSIDWDGSVSPCCLDYDREMTVGNIKKDDLLDIWNSDVVNAIRTILSHKRQDLLKMCSVCELNYSFRGKVDD